MLNYNRLLGAGRHLERVRRVDPKTRIELFDLLFKIGAAVVAAAWALALLFLIHRPLARAGLLKSEMEVEEHERKKNLQAGLSINLHGSAHPNPGGKGYVIVAIVEITNRDDSQMKRIAWEGEAATPFHVRLASFDKGKPDYDGEIALCVRSTSNPNAKSSGHRIRPGATESLSFAAHVSARGVYLLSFRIPVDPNDIEAAKKLGLSLPAAWTCNRHIVVDDSPAPAAVAAA
jgi:hypothetical protein